MSAIRVFALAASLAVSALASPAGAASGPPRAELQPNDYVIGSWELYRSKFVKEDGRVVDDDNGSISHSEGQGYGMLIAASADDRDSFRRIWNWTHQELFIRPDGLAAWRWDPAAQPRVTDTNDATDGDLLIAWALLRASERWNIPDYRARARQIVDALADHAVIKAAGGRILLPGVSGFEAQDQADGPVVNLSYWVFPALSELETISPKLAKTRLSSSGLKLAELARFGEADLPTDWIALGSGTPAPAKAFPATFGYNAVRVPLYLAWEGQEDGRLLEPYFLNWSAEGAPGPHVIDVSGDFAMNALDAPGYGAIADLVACSLNRGKASERTKNFVPTTYYPSTLHILSLMALAERYPQCL